MIKFVSFVILAIVTFLCHSFVERYEINGPEILTNSWQSSSDKGEIPKNVNHELSLLSKNSDKSVQFRQDIPNFKQGDILMLSADMKYSDIVPGEKPWNLARLLLIQNDGTKDRYDHMHAVASFSGNRDWESYCGLFAIGKDTKHIRIIAQLSQCTGSFHLKNIQLYSVNQTIVYPWIQFAILFFWGIFAVFLLGTCFGNGNMIILKVLLVVSFVIIIVGTTIPREMRYQVAQEVSIQLQKTSNVFQHSFSKDIAKLGHFGFIALFGIFLCLLKGKNSFWQVMFNILLLAGGTEIAQIFIDGRSPLFADFFIDLAGGIFGVTLTSLILKKKENNLAVKLKIP